MMYEILIGGAFFLIGCVVLPWVISKSVAAKKIDEWWNKMIREQKVKTDSEK